MADNLGGSLMVNVYDSANQLAEDLQKTPEYEALEKAIKQVESDEQSKALFKRMDEVQGKIIQAQQSGQEVSSDVQTEYQKLNGEVQKDKNIVNLLTVEQGLYKLMGDLQKTYTKPINDLYQDLRNN